MTAAGWVMLGSSWLVIATVAGYCLYRTLRVGGLKRDEGEPDRR